MRRSTTPRGLPPNTISRCICRDYTPFVHLGVSFGVSGRPCGSPFWAAGGRGPALPTQAHPGLRRHGPVGLGSPAAFRKATLRQRPGLARPLGLPRPCLARGPRRPWASRVPYFAPLSPQCSKARQVGLACAGACLERAKDPQPVTRELVACAATVSVSTTGPWWRSGMPPLANDAFPGSTDSAIRPWCLGAEPIIGPQGSVAPLIVSCLASLSHAWPQDSAISCVGVPADDGGAFCPRPSRASAASLLALPSHPRRPRCDRQGEARLAKCVLAEAPVVASVLG